MPDLKYQQWIVEKYQNMTLRGKCHSIADHMRQFFPELILCRGVYMVSGTCHMHWWLKTPDGEIVDPSAAQFDPGGRYEEYNPEVHKNLLFGYCLGCERRFFTLDDEVSTRIPGFRNSFICSEECTRKLEQLPREEIQARADRFNGILSR